MTDEPETFAAVVAKMREQTKRDNGIMAVYLNGYADRLVAAHEREVKEVNARSNDFANKLTDAEEVIYELKATIAELKEALRKIANDKGTGCVIVSCPFANDDSVYCENCTNSAGEVARAALEKTEGEGETK